MNLAEIRKKAQKPKMTQPPAAPPDEPIIDPVEPVPSPDVFESKAPELLDQITSAEPQQMLSPEAPLLRQPAVAMPVTGPQGFDPLAVIMAGREAVGDEDEALVEAREEATKDVEEFQELLCFRVSTERYAINILDIKEIIKPREVTEVPRVPSFVSGVLSLRGIIIPVFNMRKRLELPAATGLSKERIIVIKKKDELCGLLVDEVIQVVRIAAGKIEPPPAVLDAIDRDFVSGIGRHQNMMLILLNLENILDVSLC